MRILSVKTLLKCVKETQSINTGFQGSLLEVQYLPFSVSKAVSLGLCQRARREKEEKEEVVSTLRKQVFLTCVK